MTLTQTPYENVCSLLKKQNPAITCLRFGICIFYVDLGLHKDIVLHKGCIPQNFFSENTFFREMPLST